jgi:hypothetical protein
MAPGFARNGAKTTGRAAHDPTQVETLIDFDRLGRLVAGSAGL